MAFLCGNSKRTLATSTINMHLRPEEHEEIDELQELEKLGNGCHTRGTMDHMTVVMKRGKKGYGFTLNGNNPSKISKIEPSSSADQAGLKVQDFVIRINGQNVSKMATEAVAYIVKQSDKQIIMDVHRYRSYPLPQQTSNKGTSVQVNQVSEPYKLSDSSSDSGQGSLSPSEMQMYTSQHYTLNAMRFNGDLPQPPWLVWKEKRISPWQLYHELKERQAHVFSCSEDSCSEYSDSESCYSCSTLSMTESELTDVIPTYTPPVREDIKSSKPPLPPRKPKLKPSERTASQINCSSVNRSETYNKEPNVCSVGKENCVENGLKQKFHDRNSDSDTVVSDVTGRYSGSMSDSGSDKTDQPTKTAAEMMEERQRVYPGVYLNELHFCQGLQFAVHMYSRPLSNCVLSPQQHQVLFQNMEQLCSISENLLSQLHTTKNVPTSQLDSTACDNFTGIYVKHLDMMCTAYEEYCVGVRDAVQLLGELKSYEGFDKFVEKLSVDSSQPTLNIFIQMPVQHIKDLTLQMMKAYKNTPATCPEYKNLQKIVKALRKTTSIISEEYIRRSKASLASISTIASLDKFPPSVTSHNSSSSSSSVSSSTMDIEVLDIHHRLQFVDGVQACNLVKTSRHVIYKGNLLMADEENMIQVYAVLMSDLVLLTQQGHDNQLILLEDPILLQDIKDCTSGEWHPSEFVLKVECHHCETLGIDPKFYTFRAPTLELKCVWKNIIQHRLERNNKKMS